MMAANILGDKGMKVVPLTLAEKEGFRKLSQQPVIDWAKTQTDPQWPDDLFKAVAEVQDQLKK